MTIDEMLERRAAIAEEIEKPDADLNALEEELRGINEKLETAKQEAAQKQEIRETVAEETKNIETVQEFHEERKTMTNMEVRKTHEYNVAYATYIKTEKDDECRALLTEQVTGGTVPVPSYVEDRVRTNWDRLGLMKLVRKTYIKGILRVGYEASAGAAVAHTEGTTAPSEETLTLGVITLAPVSLKKWIKISDEVMDLKGEAFLDYIYDEITYQIAKLAQKNMIAAITALTAGTATNKVSVGIVTGTPSLGVVAEALGKLGDEAENPVIVMNKASWAKFKAAQYAGSFNVDPFEGMDVYFDSSLPTYSNNITGSTWAIVGDFGFGAQVNFPNGDEVTLKFDDKSLAEADLVKVVGREYAGIGIVGDKAFTKIIG